MLVYILIILIFIVGIFLAIVTSKIFPNFLSKRDYYRKSRYEIFKLRGGATISVFVTIIYIGATLLSDEFKEKNHNNKKTETEVHKGKSKTKRHKKTVVSNSTNTNNELSPTNSKVTTYENIESNSTEISTDSIINHN